VGFAVPVVVLIWPLEKAKQTHRKATILKEKVFQYKKKGKKTGPCLSPALSPLSGDRNFSHIYESTARSLIKSKFQKEKNNKKKEKKSRKKEGKRRKTGAQIRNMCDILDSLSKLSAFTSELAVRRRK
jgi:hypothetical protein